MIILWLEAETGIILQHDFQSFFAPYRRTIIRVYDDVQPDLVADQGQHFKILDHPNSRSLHTTPVTRTGGLGMLPGILISWALLPAALPLSVWIGFSLLAAVSLADDVFTLPICWRLLAHGSVAAWFAALLLADSHGWLITAVATVTIVWMINLYNFMDGSDGLAGGMTLIGFGCYGLAAWLAGNEIFAMLNFCIVAVSAAFLLI